MAGLNYRFIGNLHACVFLTYKTEIMSTSNDFITCHPGTGRYFKTIFLIFSSAHISSSYNLVYLANTEF